MIQTAQSEPLALVNEVLKACKDSGFPLSAPRNQYSCYMDEVTNQDRVFNFLERIRELALALPPEGSVMSKEKREELLVAILGTRGEFSDLVEHMRESRASVISALAASREEAVSTLVNANLSLLKANDTLKENYRNEVARIVEHYEKLIRDIDRRDTKFLGLLNYRGFREEVIKNIRIAQAGDIYALGFTDMRDFKSVNDKFGHAVGDKVLDKVAEIMRMHMRSPGPRRSERDLWARVGGDESAFLITRLPDEGSARGLAERFRNNVAECDWSSIHPDLSAVHIDIGIVGLKFLGIVENPENEFNEAYIEADKIMLAYKDKGLIKMPIPIKWKEVGRVQDPTLKV